MATKKNFKSVMSSVWYWVKEGGLAVAGVFGFLVICIMETWPMFFLLALVVPKFASRLIYGRIESDFPGFAKCVRKLNGWIIALIPFFRKKLFMEEAGIQRFSPELQLKYYFNYKRNGLTVQEMSSKAYELLWRDARLQQKDYYFLLCRTDAKIVYQGLNSMAQIAAYMRLGQRSSIVELMTDEAVEDLWDTSRDLSNDYSNVVIAGRVLNDDMFQALCSEVPQMVGTYVIKHTPSDNMLLHLFSKRSNFADVLTYCIHKYGLSAKVVRQIDRMGILSEYEDTLREYMQRTFLQRHSTESAENKKLVKAFFSDMEHLTGYAQVIMKPWQYRLFHEADLTLNEEVIQSFIEKEDIPMIKAILELESDIDTSDLTGALAMANPTIAELVISASKPGVVGITL